MSTPRPPRSRLLPFAVTLAVVSACSMAPMQVDRGARAPVIDGFGATTLQPSQANPAARALFAQGMAQVYAFNGGEAIRAFKAALAQDPECALCAWGVAYQMGPNINDPVRGDLREAIRYASYAKTHSAGATPRDLALIDALVLRYGQSKAAPEVAMAAALCRAGAGGERADPLDVAYAQRMRDVQARFADDPDVLSIYAEAEMVATRGSWWNSATGKPAGRIGELADLVEAGLARHPDHVGLNHYMIHVVDAVPVARRAEAAADRLGRLAPKSPHLVHMPSHTYANVGRYADATRVNQQAVAADDAMDAELQRQNFKITRDWRGHNLHFAWYGALMEGRGQLALDTARTKAARSKGDNEFGEYERSLPLLTLVQLQRWDAVLAEPLPRGDKGVAIVLAQMARGAAFARTRRVDEARAAQARLDLAAAPLLKKYSGEGFMDKLVGGFVKTAQLQLQAELALASGDGKSALARQATAVTSAIEADEQSEPPMLAGAPRLRLGAMQLQLEQYADAEKTYRDALAARPGSGWALSGLRAALEAQGKRDAARAVDGELARSWPLADGNLRAQR
jgi:tetratricopeptide (TPR) repeat protein